MYHFCTITTADHIYKVRALCDSLRNISADVQLHVLCVDTLPAQETIDNISYYTIEDIAAQPTAPATISKYSSSKDKLRWCLKPVFLRYLLEQQADKVIYTDNDIYFYSDYGFLFDLLSTHSFLLTPHHYPRDPGREQNWLEANFKVGLYNAGCVGVSKNAISALQWWADCCAYRCEKSALRGTFDDQKYLDLIPVIDEHAHIVRHKGCNVAEWNRKVISRSEKDGQVMLDGQYPLVFIHYNGTTVSAINQGVEPYLQNSFNSYMANLKKYKPNLNVANLEYKPRLLDKLKYQIWKLATDAGW